MIPAPPPPINPFPYAGQQVIDFFTTAHMSDVKDYYVTEETRQEIYVHFKNKIKRGIWYTFKWKDIGGGVWQITGLE
jgi:hypothetical protein